MAIIKQDSKIVKDNQLIEIENVIDSQAKADAAEANAKSYTDSKIASLPAPPVTSVNGKIGDVSITKDDVGLGNLDNVKQASKAEFDDHANNTNNPHGVTKAQVGLGNVQNYGIASQAQAEAGTANNVYMTPQRTKQAIDTHANNKSNPHSVTKAQVGLGNVQNYGIATQAQAEAGTANNVYMTPLRTKQAIDINLNSHLMDYVRQPGYAVTGGSGNAYTITLSPAPSAYVDGMGVVIRANRDNTGASTLNVNGLGARAIKKPNGNDVAAGNLKAGGIYTFRYNATAGNFILQGEGGDFGSGDTITDARLLPLSGGMGAEVWSKTDVANGRGIAVDSAGYVYCAHYISSGKTIRKLDSSGNEVWYKNDVAYGYGIAVDSAGNVYCAHEVSSGKAVRKLDSSGNEVWYKNDVAEGRGIAVDSAGYVYCAHGVASDKAIRKLDSSGNEVWAKTDVAYGNGIAVDSAGYVYCTHSASGGGKTIRKLDSSGNEVWAKTDVGSGEGIAVDSAGYVYCAHYISSGKTIRKLDSSGNEVWYKNDVAYGYGIAVDSAGNVYCTHNVRSDKAVRKLDSSGNEVWAKTDVANGRGIAVDSAGYVYCAHHVSSEKAVRKLDGNKYFRII